MDFDVHIDHCNGKCSCTFSKTLHQKSHIRWSNNDELVGKELTREVFSRVLCNSWQSIKQGAGKQVHSPTTVDVPKSQMQPGLVSGPSWHQHLSAGSCPASAATCA